MSSTYISKIRILAGLSIVLMVLSFITAHSWFLQIITLSLGASALISVFARLRHARRTDAGNQSLLLPDHMPEGGAPITNGIALNTQFFQLLSLGMLALLPVVFFVVLLTAFRGNTVADRMTAAS